MFIVDSMGTANVQVERDHSPLADVEAGLFVDDFSFGGSSTSASGSRSPNGGVGEALSAAATGVVSPVDTGVDPVTFTSTSSPHSSLYSDSESPDMEHFQQHYQNHHHHDHLGGLRGHIDRSTDLLPPTLPPHYTRDRPCFVGRNTCPFLSSSRPSLDYRRRRRRKGRRGFQTSGLYIATVHWMLGVRVFAGFGPSWADCRRASFFERGLCRRCWKWSWD